MTAGVRIAMWSGPRNISTALMRAWENRSDTVVWDEPLYAYYLKASGADHPGAQEVIAAGIQDWREVAAAATGPIPGGHPIYFQKHMTHHLLSEVDRGWLARVVNCFLIRDPREVIASYVKTRPQVTLEDVGVPQQADIFRYVCERTGKVPPVIDTRDVLEEPRATLSLLCEATGTEFSEKMLAWPEGGRPSDGVWAKYWYASVHKSTGFAPYVSKAHTLPKALEPLAERCAPYYRMLYEQRLRP